MQQKKCFYCGGYLPTRPFYIISRGVIGSLYVWICPNCGKKIEEWRNFNAKNER